MWYWVSLKYSGERDVWRITAELRASCAILCSCERNGYGREGGRRDIAWIFLQFVRQLVWIGGRSERLKKIRNVRVFVIPRGHRRLAYGFCCIFMTFVCLVSE